MNLLLGRDTRGYFIIGSFSAFRAGIALRSVPIPTNASEGSVEGTNRWSFPLPGGKGDSVPL